eukprot:jgi/Chlat1/3412/Chrsp23S03750
MIRAVVVVNGQGKPRLTRFYHPSLHSSAQQQNLVRLVYSALSARTNGMCCIVQDAATFGPGIRVVYRHYATLFLAFVVDAAESDLAILDMIQVYVETLDRCFANVCELDFLFNFNKAHAILDEVIMGGLVLETSPSDIMKAVMDKDRLEKMGEQQLTRPTPIGGIVR